MLSSANRPTFLYFQHQTLLPGGGFKTSCSCEHTSRRTSLPALCPLCQTSTDSVCTLEQCDLGIMFTHMRRICDRRQV